MSSDRRGIIAWFTTNPVAANLLMVGIVVSGIATLLSGAIKLEVFPDFTPNIVTVSVAYPGATPHEVEESICIRIEEAVQGISGVREVRSTAAENGGAVAIEIEAGADLRAALDDIKNRVDGIDTFPALAERPVVQEVVVRNQVISIAVRGAVPEATRKELAERVRDELTTLPGITQVELASVRPYEVTIALDEPALRRYGLTFDQVAHAVRRSSLDLPAGSIETTAGEVLLRTKGQAYDGSQFAALPLLTRADGTRVLLGDVATIVDGFADHDQSATFDGEPCALVQVFRTGDQSALAIAEQVHAYVARTQPAMPAGVTLTTWWDQARFLQGRLDLLLEDTGQGFLLVFLMVALFLRFRLAFWVCLDIPVSFLGAIALMPLLDVSINMISLFAFIVVLGIVVDDAIVVGENVHRHADGLQDRVRATIRASREVAVSVTFGVMVTMTAFLPMTAVPGPQQKIWRVIPLIVIPTLLFSLLDSKLVLPSHLAHMRPENPNPRGIPWLWSRVQAAANALLSQWIERVHRPLLTVATKWRYLTVAGFTAVLVLTAGAVGGGLLRFQFFPQVEADNAVATLVMPQGTPAAVTRAAIDRIEQAALAVGREFGDGVVRHVLASVGEQPFRQQQSRNGGQSGQTFLGSQLGEVNIELVPSEERTVRTQAVLEAWRERVGGIAGAVELTFTSSIFSAGDDIDVRLSAANLDTLRAAADDLGRHLSGIVGVADVADSFRSGKQELELDIRPAAETLSLTRQDLARQVRQGFHGEEVQRVQRGRDDVKVMLRYPAEDRVSLGDLESMRIRTQDGAEVPFGLVADARHVRGPATIQRTDRRRTVEVTAAVDEQKANDNEIVAGLKNTVLPGLVAAHPGLVWQFAGEQKQQAETLEGLAVGFIVVLFLIYALMAIPLKSYAQPLVVMTAIPFGAVGAAVGHVLFGLDLTIMTIFGLVALAGVAVNDSLVLVEFVNQARAAGASLLDAVRQASMIRFRAILLTSGTTFVGLLPLVLNKSVQAQFLIPMGVAVAFGSVFATGVSLLLVPCLCLVLDDVRRVLRFGRSSPSA
ncbi:MAG: efflux RND transporter permease subunit [Planctomycetes bacterium]|nr:efflux RND transporter permease subunit [Planctomycetota bacterium]